MKHIDLPVGKADHVITGVKLCQSASASILLRNNPPQESIAHIRGHLLLTRTCEIWPTYTCLGFKVSLGSGLLHLTPASFGPAAS